jgi:hypothetical protein
MKSYEWSPVKMLYHAHIFAATAPAISAFCHPGGHSLGSTFLTY